MLLLALAAANGDSVDGDASAGQTTDRRKERERAWIRTGDDDDGR